MKPTDKLTQLQRQGTINPQELNLAEKWLGPARLQHTLAVLENGQLLCSSFDGLHRQQTDFFKTIIFHDLARDLPRDTQQQLATDYRGKLDQLELKIPALWHGPAAARLLVEKLHYSPDDQIVRAVAEHSTGAPKKNLLADGLVVADFSSTDRKFAAARRIRDNFTKKSLERLTLETLRYKIGFCLQKFHRIHPRSVEAYNRVIR